MGPTSLVPTFAINFGWLRRRPRWAAERFLDDLQPLPTIAAVRQEVIDKDFSRYPTMPISGMAAHLDTIIGAVGGSSDRTLGPRRPP